MCIFPKDGPGEKPVAATNLTLTQEAGGWVLRWIGPNEKDLTEEDPKKIIYYTVEHKQDSQVIDIILNI